jgi:hypothetical protein
VVDEMLRGPDSDEAYHPAIELLRDGYGFSFDVGRKVFEPELLGIDPMEGGCSSNLINLLADIEIRSWIETANVHLGPLAGIHMELTGIAHV